MDWELEQRNIRLEDMIIVYQENIETLEEENDQLKKKIAILEQKLSVMEDYDDDDEA